MAKKQVKGKTKYSPFLTTDGEGLTDTQVAMKRYKTQANCAGGGCGGGGGGTRTRENTGYQNQLSNKFFNFYSGFSADGSGDFSVTDAIRLCQLAYFNNGTIGNVLDIMQEFSVSDIDFISKNSTARDIMLSWSKSIRLKGFLDAVALEYYRSGNVYIYRFDGTIKNSDLRNLDKAFGNSLDASIKVPTKYTLINPVLMNCVRSGLVDVQRFLVTIPYTEVMIMLQQFESNPNMFDGLPQEFQTALQTYNGKKDLIIELDPAKMTVLHRKKQPYEKYAVPFLARVLDDLDFKKELRSMDRALARVVSRMLIHVKVGKDDLIPSPAALEAINQKLANSSTSTYLVTDHTVAVSQYFPDVGALLDPKKYVAIDNDIGHALGISMAALVNGDGSFSNNFLGIKILIERIKDGRSKILDDFLIPEIDRTKNAFKIKGDVTPEIIGVDLNNEQEWAKIYTRLYELGVFSAESTIESIRENRFPTYDEELVRQKEMVDARAEGLFVPNLNHNPAQEVGRPTGVTNPPQTKMKKTSPIGATILRVFTEAEHKECKAKVVTFLKNNHKIKKLTVKQDEIADKISVDYLGSNPLQDKTLNDYLSKYKV